MLGRNNIECRDMNLKEDWKAVMVPFQKILWHWYRYVIHIAGYKNVPLQ